MNRWKILFAVTSFSVFSLSASCTTMSIPGDANTTDGSSNDMVSLTVQLQLEDGVKFVGVVGFANKGNVHRADAEQNITPRAFSLFYSPGDPDHTTQLFPKGTQICLICNETEAITLPTNTSVSPIPTTTAGQFVSWSGDTQGSSSGSDSGVLFFTLNENRIINARFDLMHGVVFRSQGGAVGTGTLLDISITEQAPLTIPPQIVSSSLGANVVGTGLTGQQGKIGKAFFFRDGTVIKLTVPAGSPFTSWSGAGQISGREDTFTFGQTTQVADLLWP